MSETQIIKLVFGIFLSVGSAVLLLIAFKLYYKYLIQEKKCTAKTVGTVVRLYIGYPRRRKFLRVPAGRSLHRKRENI